MLIQDQFGIIQNLQTSHFAASYSKIALTQNMTTDRLLDYEFTTKTIRCSFPVLNS
jgi:hypothetical protein